MRWAWAVLAVCGLAFAGDGDEDGGTNTPQRSTFTQRDLEEMQRGLWRVRTWRGPMRLPLAPRPLRPLGPRGMPLPQGGPGQVPAEAPAPDANAPVADAPQADAPPGADPGVQAPNGNGGNGQPVVKRPPPPPRPKD
ncbi:MAG: hypothetical protein AAB434_01040 [Planctomycetota bacterium]